MTGGVAAKAMKLVCFLSFSFFLESKKVRAEHFHTSPRTVRIALKLRCCLHSLNSLFKLIWQWISGIKMGNLLFTRHFVPWLNVF